ncbi:hypothetical protein [Streptomyces sp. NPDC058247]|uniref:hypothetical protein n=1 Tax=Streptomyces sp. NPDC058247 TaxID=3346401 RepID=UPI0036E7F61F
MSENWRIRFSVLCGASALALSVVTGAPAQADDSSGDLVEVEMPADVQIVEGVTPEPGAALPSLEGTSRATAASSTCLGTTSAYGSKGCFQHDGDIVWAYDSEADGMSAAVGVYTDYGRAAEVCINSLSAGTWATCNKDYSEDGNVRLQVLRYDGDTGKFYQPEAWSGWIPVDGQY